MRIYIYTGTQTEFEAVVMHMGGKCRSNYIRLVSSNALRGIRKPIVYKYGTFYMNPEHELIELMLQHNYAEVHHITERILSSGKSLLPRCGEIPEAIG